MHRVSHRIARRLTPDLPCNVPYAPPHSVIRTYTKKRQHLCLAESQRLHFSCETAPRPPPQAGAASRRSALYPSSQPPAGTLGYQSPSRSSSFSARAWYSDSRQTRRQAPRTQTTRPRRELAGRDRFSDFLHDLHVDRHIFLRLFIHFSLFPPSLRMPRAGSAHALIFKRSFQNFQFPDFIFSRFCSYYA